MLEITTFPWCWILVTVLSYVWTIRFIREPIPGKSKENQHPGFLWNERHTVCAVWKRRASRWLSCEAHSRRNIEKQPSKGKVVNFKITMEAGDSYISRGCPREGCVGGRSVSFQTWLGNIILSTICHNFAKCFGFGKGVPSRKKKKGKKQSYIWRGWK